MIPKISRGASMAGLMAYLAGPGRENEHALPHVIAGEGVGGVVLEREDAIELAHTLDAPRQAHETAVLVKGQEKHVWHCSLSLSPEEAALSDGQWRSIAEGFVDRMGFGECRWVAVRHGLSKNGGDHVHVAVSLVQDDGRVANVWNDRPRAQEACGELERAHGLAVVEAREIGVGGRGVARPALDRARARGEREPESHYLERVVRACSVEARSEREHVRLVRARGVKVTPRMARGSSTDVVGYSYSVKGSASYGGGRLAKDLSLPRLRAQWENPGEGTADQAARMAAGRLAAKSLRTEREPGPLAAESRELGRFAQTRTSGRGLVLSAAVASALRERVRAANREAELERELEEERARPRVPARDRGIDIGF